MGQAGQAGHGTAGRGPHVSEGGLRKSRLKLAAMHLIRVRHLVCTALTNVRAWASAAALEKTLGQPGQRDRRSHLSLRVLICECFYEGHFHPRLYRFDRL